MKSEKSGALLNITLYEAGSFEIYAEDIIDLVNTEGLSSVTTMLRYEDFWTISTEDRPITTTGLAPLDTLHSGLTEANTLRDRKLPIQNLEDVPGLPSTQ